MRRARGRVNKREEEMREKRGRVAREEEERMEKKSAGNERMRHRARE